jgi:hypothetical protein
MRIYILILTILQTCLPGISQENKPKKTRRMSIQELYVQPGFMIQADKSVNLADFKKLNPPTLLLNSDYSSSNNGYSSYISANTTFTGLIGIKFRNKEKAEYKTNPVLRIGLQANSGINLNNRFFNESKKPYDTLVSVVTGEEFPLDSFINEYVSISYQSRQLRLDVSLIFNIRPEKRWSFFYGIGANAGVSTSSEIEFQYNQTGGIIGEVFEYNVGKSGSISNFYQRVDQKTNSAISIYAPVGINFRIGKPGRKWENIFIYYEARPMVNVTSIPQLQTFTSSAFQQGIGMKFNL